MGNLRRFRWCMVLWFSQLGLYAHDAVVTSISVDLGRYSGIWYEIAKVPNSFQRKCVSDTSASYTVAKNGSIGIVNSCKIKEGGFIQAQGVAYSLGKANNKLLVSFIPVIKYSRLITRLIGGDYWIFILDQNYQYAVVGSPKENYLWILSRTKKIDNKLYDKLINDIKKKGLPAHLLQKTQQNIKSD